MGLDYKQTNQQASVQARKVKLRLLLRAIVHNEDEIIAALSKDFRKPSFEAVVTETAYVTAELKYVIKHLARWAKPKKINGSWLNFPSRDFIYHQPYGEVLIISPWNYPFQLALCPLIVAIAAGNSVVLKPSELTPATNTCIEKIMASVFLPNEVKVVQGGPKETQELLERKWDYIFFTGSYTVGQIVAQRAAKYITPITLELGGKSPCIVDSSADLSVAAKRIVWGKFLNAGQTCIAPDFVVVNASVRDKLIDLLKKEITAAYGLNMQQSIDLARIVNEKHFNRLLALLEGEQVLFGGEHDRQDRYIAPTLIAANDSHGKIMSEEIFGPLLPIISYDTPADLHQILTQNAHPLALYVFTDRPDFAEQILTSYSFGGGCVNDVILHVANRNLPFGGVGSSGMGAYHGQFGFETFSHRKAIVKRPTWIDPALRYAPYGKKTALVRKLVNWLS